MTLDIRALVAIVSGIVVVTAAFFLHLQRVQREAAAASEGLRSALADVNVALAKQGERHESLTRLMQDAQTRRHDLANRVVQIQQEILVAQREHDRRIHTLEIEQQGVKKDLGALHHRIRELSTNG